MLNFLNQILAVIQSVFSTLLIPFQMVQRLFEKKIKLTPTTRYLLEFVLVLVVVGGLFALNVVFDLGRIVEPPPRFRSFRNVWLALLGLLVYLAVRLFIFILQQLPKPIEEFPDIDEAMAEGLAALAEARVDIRDVPLFLVVGMTPPAEESFQQSSFVGKEIQVHGRGLPIHWYGNEKGVWVCIPGVSALTQQALLSSSGATSSAPALEDHGKTWGGAADASSTLAGDAGRFATMAGGAQFQTLGAIGGPSAAPAGVAVAREEGYRSPARRLTNDEKDLAQRRLIYFIKSLRDARYPVCSINGVLLVLPYQWTTSPGFSQLSDCAQVDMSTLQNHLGVKALCLTVFDGIEQSPEFCEYVQRLDKTQLERRCGCGFPPLINPETADIERSHGWLIQYFERQIFELYQKKLGDNGNGKLFRLLDILRKSRQNLTRLLHHSFPDDVPEPFYFGGLYFAALAQIGKVQRPFFDGVVAKLVKEHDDIIGWNEQALEEDQRYSRLAYTAMFFVVVLTVLNAALVFWILFGKG
ncbi:MAG: type VI secretion protein IcmF/TssM N-terminal domain-containing protein [Planctomycetota bacterium]